MLVVVFASDFERTILRRVVHDENTALVVVEEATRNATQHGFERPLRGVGDDEDEQPRTVRLALGVIGH